MRLLILFILTGFFSQLQAQTDVSAPQTLSQNGETYTLTQNITADDVAFTITGDNITLDLNFHEVTFNNVSRGAGVEVKGNNNTVINGKFIQGADQDPRSPAIRLTGTGHTVGYVEIKVSPIIPLIGGDDFAAGIEMTAIGSTVHHAYIENNGTTTNTSALSPRGIHANQQTTAGLTINDNIIVNAHLGINLVFVGRQVANPDQSLVFNNKVQQVRTPGTKAPYGIQLAQTRNVLVYNNQIISDEGRGIMLDGFGQGVVRGTDFVEVFNNRVDVEYNQTAQAGAFPENNVYGLRDRYTSGNNHIHDNTFMVNNHTGGIASGMYIGSDAQDDAMQNLLVENNNIITLSGTGDEAGGLVYSVVNVLDLTGNNYLTPGNFIICNFTCANYGGPNNTINQSSNTEINPAAYTPAKPTGLTLRKFFDSYLLEWNDNRDAPSEAQTFEYVVYKDGAPMDMSTRGGTFFVDTNISGAHTYTIVAKNLNGDLSVQSDSISTTTALSGWSDSALRPLPPSNIIVGPLN